MERGSRDHIDPIELARLLEETRNRSESCVDPAAQHPHLAFCLFCKEQFQNLASFDRQLESLKPARPGQRQADCPDAAVWRDMAGGLTPPEATLICVEHASWCDYCGPLLRRAVAGVIELKGEITDAERKHIASLESAGEAWQHTLARRITGAPRPVPEPKKWWGWLPKPGMAGLRFGPRWALAGLALTATVAVGSWLLIQRNQPSAADELLARAYTEKRTLELRIPGAAYAPLRIQKGSAASFIARPATLLKAEALIGAQLPVHPDDPAWLQAAARADVLEGKYDAAVGSLQRASELKPHSPELLSDLGTARFQRAQAEDRQEDYSAAFECFSEVLALQPENAIALFNRAIIAEHQFLYRQALDDWQHFLKLDSHSEWAEEARTRLEVVRTKLKEHGSGALPLLSPDQVAATANPDLDLDLRVEQYLDAAVRLWLPQAYPDGPTAGNAPTRQALFVLADLTVRKHHDRWLSDLLQGSSTRAFPRAVAALSRASQTNDSGDYAESRIQADVAAQLFRASGNRAGVLRAQFERAFSGQMTRRTADCLADAAGALKEAELLPYSWLQIELGLEKGVCSLLGKDDWGGDERISRRALDRARQSNYDSLSVRALYFEADDQIKSGDLSAGVASAAKALQQYWSAHIPVFRAYNLYNLLGSVPEFYVSRPHFVVAVWREATALLEFDDNLLERASAHSFAARAAAAVNEPETAQREYSEAARLLALAPKTDAIRNHILKNEILAAGVEGRLGRFEYGISRLTGIQKQIEAGSDKYVDEMFYATLGELELRSHHPSQAEQAFRPALDSAERRLRSLNSEVERLDWGKEAAPVYLGMAEAELVQGRIQESLAYFEWYLGAATRSAAEVGNRVLSSTPDPVWLTSRLPLLTDQTVLAYAELPDGLAIWTCDNRGVSAQWMPQSTQALRELAARFYDLASDPGSELTALRRDSQGLYRALIAPVEQNLDRGRSLVFEADGWLAQVPFESLLDSNRRYLIERFPIVHSLGQNSQSSLREDAAIGKDLHALIVRGAPSSETEGLVPLSNLAAEADAVARNFKSAETLSGREAILDTVEKDLPAAEVFHFTGHSLVRRNGAALMLAAPPNSDDPPAALNAERLRRLDLRNLRLAVLSTCNSESGDRGSRGFNSIAEALQRAGVPHVVASRWVVDSVKTTEFLEDFYRDALSGQPVSEAIRHASRNMLADPRTSHPYYWSAFSAYGRP